MNAETIASGQLAGILAGTAAGMLADTAAACDHRPRPLPARPRVPAHHRRRRVGHRRQPFAVIRWNAAVTALENGYLPCTGSERAVLLIAASLAEGIPVSLRDCLGSLDRRNIALVTDAITTANG